MKNREVADLFEKVAQMLSIRGDNIHRVLAYRRAAEAINALGRDVNKVHAAGELTQIPGIGKTLAAKIEEMLDTGRLEFFEKLSQEVPPQLVEMLRVEGLGPKRVKQIYESLGIQSMQELAVAAKEGKLKALPRMGAKSEARIVAAIDALSRHGDNRTPLGEAWPQAQRILGELSRVKGVTKVAVAGSLRRMRETIGDIDLLVAAGTPDAVMERFCSLENIESVAAKGSTKSRIVLLNGMGVDLRVLPVERWGTLLSYFTGSKAHNVRLRERALKLGYSLNEHALTPTAGGEEILCSTEEALYQALELPYVPPVLRQGQGEIEAALAGAMPNLVVLADIISDLHMHTTWSDGKMNVRQMASAAQGRGLTHIVITDHSASLGIANGLSVERLREQAAEVRLVDEETGPDFRVLHGTEMEIRSDGSLDYPDDLLAELDFVIASLHTGLRQSRERVTDRMLNAIWNPHVDMIAHPTGRLFPDRAGASLDMDFIFEAAAASGTILEINAHPQRLDLRDKHVRRALEFGVKLSINTDAHHADHFDMLHFGVATAQRGWATAQDVVNTWPVAQLLAHVG
jgi:DNA polymerase (family 10)